MNVDETNVQLYMDKGAGHLSLHAHYLKRGPKGLSRQLSRGEVRSAATHVFAICDIPALQASLPQLLIVSERLVTAAEFDAMRSSLPPSFYVLRQTKAWVNTDSMRFYAQLLRKHLAGIDATHRVILYLDVYKAHCAPPVLKAFGDRSILLCFIPASLTWALQPCDTHAFAMYKAHLATALQTEATELTADGRISWGTLARCICQTMERVINTHTWAKAFRDVGLVGRQDEVSERVRIKLSVDADHLVVPSSMPTLLQFQAVFPKRSVLHFELLFRGLLRSQQPAPLAKARPQPPPIEIGPEVPPWLGRTRSTSSQAAVSAPRAASPPTWPPAMAPVVAPLLPPPFLPSAKRLHRPRSRKLEGE